MAITRVDTAAVRSASTVPYSSTSLRRLDPLGRDHPRPHDGRLGLLHRGLSGGAQADGSQRQDHRRGGGDRRPVCFPAHPRSPPSVAAGAVARGHRRRATRQHALGVCARRRRRGERSPGGPRRGPPARASRPRGARSPHRAGRSSGRLPWRIARRGCARPRPRPRAPRPRWRADRAPSRRSSQACRTSSRMPCSNSSTSRRAASSSAAAAAAAARWRPPENRSIPAITMNAVESPPVPNSESSL